MKTLPSYIREGWRPNGPGMCRCPNCGATVTTNALGRAAHAKACYAKRKAARDEGVTSAPQPEKT